MTLFGINIGNEFIANENLNSVKDPLKFNSRDENYFHQLASYT